MNVTGNSCPNQYRYSGAGYCQLVQCFKRGLFGKGHSEHLANKGISCSGGAQLEWTGKMVRASNDPNCPNREPGIGYASSCEGQQGSSSNSLNKDNKPKNSNCDFKLRKYDCSYAKYLEANPSIQAWAEANPEMANKERIKLKSVD